MPRNPVTCLATPIALAVAALIPCSVAADTVDYTNQGNNFTGVLNIDNVTIIAESSPGVPAFINMQTGGGLGVNGGSNNFLVDTFEALTFSFNTFLGADVSYLITAVSNNNGNGTFGDATLEAFGPTGNSLGSVAVNGFSNIPVSSRFGDQNISGFRVRANVDTFLIKSITFTPVNEIHWRDLTTGTWDNPDNWAPSVVPTDTSAVFVDPMIGQTVFGPAAGSVDRRRPDHRHGCARPPAHGRPTGQRNHDHHEQGPNHR